MYFIKTFTLYFKMIRFKKTPYFFYLNFQSKSKSQFNMKLIRQKRSQTQKINPINPIKIIPLNQYTAPSTGDRLTRTSVMRP